MKLSALNPEQQAAVRHTDGPLLLLAGAGSGKTRVITTRLAYLLREKKIPAENLLAVTFTNKAAREMRERVVTLVGPNAAAAISISTFHALGVRVLRSGIERLGYKKNFSIYAAADQTRLIRDLIRETRGYKESKIDADQIVWRISSAKNRLIGPKQFKSGRNDAIGTATGLIYPLYQKALRACNAVDFDDILMLSTQLLSEYPEQLHQWRDQFRYVMVDEYQDTNFAQYQLLRLLCDEHRNLCVVGDDDQSIYGWRGAEPENLLEFEKDFVGAKVIKLEQNYRSTGNILTTANTVIGNNPRRHAKKLWSAEGDGAPIELITCATDEEEARTVAENILDLHLRTDTPFNDFAVLYRTNAQSRIFEELFRYENIPYVLIGGQQFFDRKEVKDALAYLQVVTNLHDEVNLLRILNYPKRGIGETSAELLIQTSTQKKIPLWDLLRDPASLADLGEKPMAAIAQFTTLLEKYRLLFSRTRQLTSTCREFFREIGLEDEIWRTSEGTEQGKRRLENLGEVFNALAAYETREVLPTLDNFLEKVSLLDYEEPGRGDKETKLERDAVVLMSLHSSKGLEFQHVFLAGMEEDCLPHRTSEGESADIEEERRLLYVGITRARKTLTLLHVRHRKKYGKPLARMPSRFLSELPGELLLRSTFQSPQASAEDQKQRGASFFAEIKAKLDL